MFKNIFLIFVIIGWVQVSLAEKIVEIAPVVVDEEEVPEFVDAGIIFKPGQPPAYDTKKLEASRVSFGIEEQNSNGSFVAYQFRGEGTFLLSNEYFLKASDAKAFCDSVSNSEKGTDQSYELIDSYFALLLTFAGLPFSSLLDTSYIYKPVLESEGLRTGVIFWVMGYSPETQSSELTPEVLAYTDGNGAGAGGIQNLDSLNNRLKKEKLNSVSLPAVCIDKGLKAHLEN